MNGKSRGIRRTSRPERFKDSHADSADLKDVNERKSAKEELRQIRERHIALFNQFPVPIGFFDRQGRLETANEAYYDMLRSTEFPEPAQIKLFDVPGLSAETQSRLLKGERATIEYDCCGHPFSSSDRSLSDRRRIRILIAPLAVDGAVFGYAVQLQDMTRRRLEEKEILQERSKLLSIFENLSQTICVVDPMTHEVLYANRSAKQVFGEDVLERPCYQSIHGVSRPCSFCPKTGGNTDTAQPRQMERYIPSADKYFRLTHQLIRWIDGREVWVNLAQDITDLRRAEESLKRSQSNFSTFFNSVDDFLFVLDTNGVIITVNDTVVERTGYSREELINEPVIKMHPRERRQEAIQIVGEILTGKGKQCPIPIMTKDGRLIPVETRVTRGKWNGFDALFGVSKDISELRLSEEKFSKTFQSNATPMALSEYGDGRFVDVNAAFLSTMGYSREEVIGKTSSDLNIFLDPADRKATLKEVQEKGAIRNVEVPVRTKEGNTRHGLFSIEQISIQGSHYLLSSMSDVTALKELERELRKGRDELEQNVLERTSELKQHKEELEVKTNTLEEVNTALKVLLRQIGEDKKDLEARFAGNIKQLVLPYIEKVRKGRLDARQEAYLSIAESNLNEIVSPLLATLGLFGLSPRETQIAGLIRDGKTTKEIADVIGVAPSAVDTYRNKIRRKLNLSNKKVNLQTYLASIK